MAARSRTSPLTAYNRPGSAAKSRQATAGTGCRSKATKLSTRPRSVSIRVSRAKPASPVISIDMPAASYTGRSQENPARMTADHDPIAFELFKNAMFSIADEMALTVFRTTYSGVLKDNMDYSTGFADAEGKLVAQGLTLPGHLGSVPTAMESIMRHYRDE